MHENYDIFFLENVVNGFWISLHLQVCGSNKIVLNIGSSVKKHVLATIFDWD